MNKPIKAVSLSSREPSTIAADSQIAQIFGGAFITTLIHGQMKNTNNVTERAASTQGGLSICYTIIRGRDSARVHAALLGVHNDDA